MCVDFSESLRINITYIKDPPGVHNLHINDFIEADTNEYVLKSVPLISHHELSFLLYSSARERSLHSKLSVCLTRRD